VAPCPMPLQPGVNAHPTARPLYVAGRPYYNLYRVHNGRAPTLVVRGATEK